MANTYVDYPASADQTDFAFNFPYLEDEHVTVEINGTATIDFTIVTSPATKVVLNSGASYGDIIRIRRRSQPDQNLVDFVNGSVLTESELDRAYRHNRYLAEEIGELNDQSLQIEAGGLNWDAKGLRIKNVGQPVDVQDASTKTYVDTQISNTITGASVEPPKFAFTGNGVDNVFTFSPGVELDGDTLYEVAIDGHLEEPTVDYVIDADADTITFTTPPADDANIVVVKRGYSVPVTGGVVMTQEERDKLAELDSTGGLTEAEREKLTALVPYPESINDGEHLVYEGLGSTTVTNKKLLVKAAASPTTAQLNFTQQVRQEQSTVAFTEILNDFYRFSHVAAVNLPYSPTVGNHGGQDSVYGGVTVNDESGWFLNSSNELSQPLNTHSAVGFSSPDLYDTYDAMVVAKSTGADDDTIGWVIALNRGAPTDDNANTPYDSTITVVRDLNVGAGVRVYYNFGLPGNRILTQNNTDFTDVHANSTGGSGWSAYDGCPIKVERRPNTIKIWAIDDSATTPDWDSSSWILITELDLTSDSDLTQFQNPGSWGLISSSQADCSWGDLYINAPTTGESTILTQPDPDLSSYVFDLEADKGYRLINNVWTEVVGLSIHDYVDSGQLLYDIAGKTLSVKDSGAINKLTSPRLGIDSQSTNFTVQADNDGEVIRADSGCSTITFDGNYGGGFRCKILNHSGASITLQSAGDTRFKDDTGTGTITLADNRMAECIGNGLNSGNNISVIITTIS